MVGKARLQEKTDSFGENGEVYTTIKLSVCIPSSGGTGNMTLTFLNQDLVRQIRADQKYTVTLTPIV
jgi:hypothetical protein